MCHWLNVDASGSVPSLLRLLDVHKAEQEAEQVVRSTPKQTFCLIYTHLWICPMGQGIYNVKAGCLCQAEDRQKQARLVHGAERALLMP